MELDLSTCSVEEFWHFVAGHLESRGIGVVLVGGAVVSVYSNDAYRSGDLDFVREALFVRQDVEGAMAEIGFARKSRHYVHPQCKHLFVEFVSGPGGIGEDTNVVPREVEAAGVALKILSPTDCVRDRLAGFIHYGTRDHMDQALLVASRHSIDWRKIERWAAGEGPGGSEAYAEFRRRASHEP